MPQELRRLLYNRLTEGAVIGVDLYQGVHEDGASVYGDYMEMRINDIFYRLHEDGSLLRKSGSRFVPEGDARITDAIAAFADQAEANLGVADILCDLSLSSHRSRGVRKVEDDNSGGRFVNFEMEGYGLVFDRRPARFGLLCEMGGEEDEILNIDEVYPKLLEIKDRLLKAEQQELRAHMEDPSAARKIKIKSSVELYRQLSRMVERGENFAAHDYLPVISIVTPTQHFLLDSNGEIMALQKHIKAKEWATLFPYFASHQPSPEEAERLIRDVMELKKIDEVGPIEVDRQAIKDAAVKSIIEQYPQSRILLLSERDLSETTDRCVMYEERIRQAAFSVQQNLVLNPMKMFDDLGNINRIREEFGISPLKIADLVGEAAAEKFRELEHWAHQWAAIVAPRDNPNYDYDEEYDNALGQFVAHGLPLEGVKKAIEAAEADARLEEVRAHGTDEEKLAAAEIARTADEGLEAAIEDAAKEVIARGSGNKEDGRVSISAGWLLDPQERADAFLHLQRADLLWGRRVEVAASSPEPISAESVDRARGRGRP